MARIVSWDFNGAGWQFINGYTRRKEHKELSDKHDAEQGGLKGQGETSLAPGAFNGRFRVVCRKVNDLFVKKKKTILQAQQPPTHLASGRKVKWIYWKDNFRRAIRSQEFSTCPWSFQHTPAQIQSNGEWKRTHPRWENLFQCELLPLVSNYGVNLAAWMQHWCKGCDTFVH